MEENTKEKEGPDYGFILLIIAGVVFLALAIVDAFHEDSEEVVRARIEKEVRSRILSENITENRNLDYLTDTLLCTRKGERFKTAIHETDYYEFANEHPDTTCVRESNGATYSPDGSSPEK